MKNITILGTGAMGSRLAKKLLDCGYDVTIFNRTKKHAELLIESGAKYVATPVDAVKDADLILSMVTNDDASKAIWMDKNNGAIHGIKKGAIAIESSSVSYSWIQKLSNEFKIRNIDFLDAPVVGSRPQVENGELIFLVGGNSKSLNTARSVLLKLSSKIIHIGKNGAGITMKLAVNAIFGVQVSALSEIVGMLEKSGIKKEKAIELLNQLPITSPALQGIGKLIILNNFKPLFPIELVEKDLSYVLDLAKSNNAILPVTTATNQTYKSAISADYGVDNIAGVVQLYI